MPDKGPFLIMSVRGLESSVCKAVYMPGMGRDKMGILLWATPLLSTFCNITIIDQIQISQAFPFHICILQVIKDWTAVRVAVASNGNDCASKPPLFPHNQTVTLSSSWLGGCGWQIITRLLNVIGVPLLAS